MTTKFVGSGQRATLPPLPLRTARVPFDACRSSLRQRLSQDANPFAAWAAAVDAELAITGIVTGQDADLLLPTAPQSEGDGPNVSPLVIL